MHASAACNAGRAAHAALGRSRVPLRAAGEEAGGARDVQAVRGLREVAVRLVRAPGARGRGFLPASRAGKGLVRFCHALAPLPLYVHH